MRYFYVILNEEKIVIGTIDTATPINISNYISTDSERIDLLNKKYVDGEFIEVDPEPEKE